MKILVLSFYYTPDLCAGSFRCGSLIKELLNQIGSNDTVELITTLPNRYSSFSQEALEFEDLGQLKIHRVKLPVHKSGMKDQIKSFYVFYKESFKKVKDNEYDLVIATSSRLFTAFLGSRIARQKSAKLYLDIRDIFVDTLKDVLSTKVSIFLLPLLKLIENFTFKTAGKINLVSEGFKSYFEKYKSIDELDFFTNGIDDEFLESISQRKIDYPVNVLYAGNIGEGQGLHKIVPQICKIASDKVRFTVLGDGGRHAHLKSKIEDLKIHNIELVPPVSRDELKEYYDRADVLFLHLNNYEAFEKVLPSKIFEYGATGKPIWAGVSGYAASFIKQHVDNSAIFSPTSAEDAILQFNTLNLEVKPRDSFVNEFQRGVIMRKLVTSILDFGKK